MVVSPSPSGRLRNATPAKSRPLVPRLLPILCFERALHFLYYRGSRENQSCPHESERSVAEWCQRSHAGTRSRKLWASQSPITVQDSPPTTRRSLETITSHYKSSPAYSGIGSLFGLMAIDYVFDQERI